MDLSHLHSRAAEARALVESLAGEIVDFLRKLISVPSLSCQEENVAALVTERMQALGFHEVWRERTGTVMGQVGTGKRAVLFDSHMDTVGVGSREAWAIDPFEGRANAVTIYGRGASDNKAGLAAMIYGAHVYRLMGAGDISAYLACVVEQENCEGWAVCDAITNGLASRGVHPEVVVITEATSNQVNRGHRGRCEVQAIFRGRSTHASAPERGVNPVMDAARFMTNVFSLNSRLKVDPFLGAATVAVTRVETVGASLNATPDECRVYLDRRLTAGETVESALAELQSLDPEGSVEFGILQYEATSYTGWQKTVPKDFPTWVLPANHPLVQAGCLAVQLATGRRPTVGKWTFSTDGVGTMGRLGIPTIGIGPGQERWSHTPFDQVDIDQVLEAVAIYALLPSTLVAISPG